MTATFTEWGIRYQVAGGPSCVDFCGSEETARIEFARWPREAAGKAICIVKREVTYGKWEDAP